jgi:RND family efflux transporter MFP subunit
MLKMLFGLFVLTALSHSAQGQEQPQSGATISTEFAGVLVPAREAEITPLVSGWLKKIRFEPNQYVQQGDLLFEFDQENAKLLIRQDEARLKAARADLALADAELERAKQLRAQNVNSEVELLRAEARNDIAAAAVQELEASIDRQNIDLERLLQKAPFAGIMSAPMVLENGWQEKVGREDIRMATITQIDPIRVSGEIPFDNYSELHRIFGNTEDEDAIEFSLVLPDGSDYEHKGRYVSDGHAFDADSQKINIWAEFPNPDLLLRPGLAVTVRMKNTRE